MNVNNDFIQVEKRFVKVCNDALKAFGCQQTAYHAKADNDIIKYIGIPESICERVMIERHRNDLTIGDLKYALLVYGKESRAMARYTRVKNRNKKKKKETSKTETK
jgi:hypothetical protein